MKNPISHYDCRNAIEGSFEGNSNISFSAGIEDQKHVCIVDADTKCNAENDSMECVVFELVIQVL